MKRRILAFALSVLMLASLVACGGNSQTDDSPPPSQLEEDADNTTPEDAAPEVEDEQESEPEDLPDKRGIIGSHGTDIRMGLTQFGLEKASISPAPEEAREIFAFSSSTSYQDTALGVTYNYSLTMDSDFQIIGASFGITNDSAPDEIFVSLAALYLSFSATMPYEAAVPEDAKAWVEESIVEFSAENEEEITITIGDAKFELFGTVTGDGFSSFWMDIRKVTE